MKKKSIPLLRSQNICEAMSGPIKDEKTQDFFSYVYRFECITRGGEDAPLLNISIGIRRFYQEYKMLGQTNLDMTTFV